MTSEEQGQKKIHGEKYFWFTKCKKKYKLTFLQLYCTCTVLSSLTHWQGDAQKRLASTFFLPVLWVLYTRRLHSEQSLVIRKNSSSVRQHSLWRTDNYFIILYNQDAPLFSRGCATHETSHANNSRELFNKGIARLFLKWVCMINIKTKYPHNVRAWSTYSKLIPVYFWTPHQSQLKSAETTADESDMHKPVAAPQPGSQSKM